MKNISKQTNYGIDAPLIVFGFAIGGIICILVSLFLNLYIITEPVISLIIIIFGFVLGSYLLSGALFMIWSSKIGKVTLIEQIVDSLALKGDENVIDIGCGRGLFLNTAARRLNNGKVTGIDIWQSKDQLGNSPETTLTNVQAEGVADRVEIKTGDMRELPFPNETIDVVISSIAIHNVHEKEEREKVFKEIDRVVKPNGQIAIIDFPPIIENLKKTLTEMGWKNITVSKRNRKIMPPVKILKGKKV
ncbi:MAG: class I SAM-dependent methyltransferase [Candidatus Lokiarchaeota archaeon]